MHILVDMDGVIADWGKQWDHVLNTMWPESRLPRHREQRTFDLKAGMDDYDRDVVDLVMNHPGFYRELSPIDGAVEALLTMVDDGHTVNVCTSPWLTNRTCLQDKVDWLETHVGVGWSKRAVVTSDKTVVHGDLLIDDKPEIVGALTPSWEHVVFDQPYNQHVTRRRLSDWSQWRSILDRQEIAA